ncbi:hypothetical protein Misp06_02172 [Microbulbifer sp. NBRC 101763]
MLLTFINYDIQTIYLRHVVKTLPPASNTTKLRKIKFILIIALCNYQGVVALERIENSSFIKLILLISA